VTRAFIFPSGCHVTGFLVYGRPPFSVRSGFDAPVAFYGPPTSGAFPLIALVPFSAVPPLLFARITFSTPPSLRAGGSPIRRRLT